MSPLSCVIFVGLFCSIYASPIVLSLEDDDVIALPDFGPRSYVAPSDKTGDLVANWNPMMQKNPEELGEQIEGDMLFPPSITRAGLTAATSKWPGGIVPYIITGNFTILERIIIFAAMNEFHLKTCIRFIPRTTQADYVRITNPPTGCLSYVGRIGGAQDLMLQTPSCLSMLGTPIHGLMHTIGFVHEHSRPDRDDFVQINVENVQAGFEHNFAKFTATQVNTFNLTYDYSSIMHFSSYAFSKNDLPTVVPLKCNVGPTMGQRAGFSVSDVARIKAMYSCK